MSLHLPVLSPTQLEAVQCPRKFAFTYWGSESGYGEVARDTYAQFGEDVHAWIAAYGEYGAAAAAELAAPEDPVAQCGLAAVPLLVPGALHEVKLTANFQGHELAVKIDMLHFENVPAIGGGIVREQAVGTDWKTGAFTDRETKETKDVAWLRENIQWNVTAYVLGSTYGWPVRLNWVYLDKKGKKLPNEQATDVYDNSAWMAAHIDNLAMDAESMWEMRPSPMEAPIKSTVCKRRGWHCDYIGHCRTREAEVKSVAEMKEEYARRKAGNQAVNPPELPTAPFETEAELEASKVAAAIGAGLPPPEPKAAKGKAKTKADLEAEVAACAQDNVDRQVQVGELLQQVERLEQQLRDAAAQVRMLEKQVSDATSYEAPAEPRSTWSLSDLMELDRELNSFGIEVSFRFTR